MNMTKLLLRLLTMLVLCQLASCAGSKAPFNLGDDPREGLSDLDFELVTEPDSIINSSEVEGWLTTTQDAVDGKDFSASASQTGVSADFKFLQGMYFEPNSAPGSGFQGRLSVRIQNGSFANNTFQGVLLFLFYVNPATHELVQLDSSRGRSGNWFDFDINALGHMVIAENTSIPRPNDSFRVSAFADQAATATGTVIHFFAIPENGVAPISYSWNMGDGTQLSGDSISHSYSSPGSYNVALTATDGAGSTAPNISTPIDITSSAPPLSDLEGTSIPATGKDLEFTFSATVVGGTAPYSYEWDFDGDGTTDSTDPPPVVFTFADYGFYIGTLKITDNNGDSITTEIVTDARRLDLAVDQENVDLGTSFLFTLDGFGLDASDTVLVDLDDGNILTNPGAQFSYIHSLPGTYVVQASASRTFEGTVYTVESNLLTLTVFANPKPVILDFTPQESPIGGRVVISGLQFGSQDSGDAVTLNGLSMNIVNWSDTLIEITIADGAADGPLVVQKDRSSDPSSILNIIPGPPDNPGGQQN